MTTALLIGSRRLRRTLRRPRPDRRNNMNTSIDRHRRLSPVLIVAVATTTMGAFAGTFGGGPVLVAVFGLAWGLALGAIATRVSRPARRRASLANGSLLLASLVAGILFGFGLLDLSLHSRLLATSPQDIGILLQPPLGDVFMVGLIALNSSLEWLLLPVLVLLNWHIPKRRTLVIGAAALYYAMRAWSYLYFVPRIFDWAELPAGQPFSTDQLHQIRLWIGLSWVRGAADGLLFVLLLVAMLVPASVVLGRRQAAAPAASSAPSVPH